MNFDDPDFDVETLLSDRSWKVRLESFEKLNDAFQSSSSEDERCFFQWFREPNLWKLGLCDNNVSVQEAAIQALHSFLLHSGRKGFMTSKPITIPCILEKCLPSTRPNTRSVSQGVLFLYAENGFGDIVFEGLLSSSQVRHPKQSLAAIKVLSAFIEQNGVPQSQKTALLGSLPGLLTNSDKNIRQAAASLSIAVYKTLGDIVKTAIFPSLKPIQVSELEQQFQKASINISLPEQTKPKKQTKSNEIHRHSRKPSLNTRAPLPTLQTSPNSFSSKSAEQSTPSSPVKTKAASTFSEFPINLNDKLAEGFFTNLNQPKWKDRKMALDQLYELCSKNQLDCDANYGDIMRSLAKCLKDANIAVVSMAAKCVATLASALGNFFIPYKSIILPAVLDRFKERKTSIVAALSKASDAIFQSCGLNEVLDDEVFGYLQHKNPQVRAETLAFISRCLTASSSCPTRACLESLCAASLNLVNDTSESVRIATYGLLAVLMKMFGEPILNKYLPGLEPKKLSRVIDLSEDVEVNAHPSQPKPKLPRVASPYTKSQESRDISLSLKVKPSVILPRSPHTQGLNQKASPVTSGKSTPTTQFSAGSRSVTTPVPARTNNLSLKTRPVSLLKVPQSAIRSSSLKSGSSRLSIIPSRNEVQERDSDRQAHLSTLRSVTTATDAEKEELEMLRTEKAVREVRQNEDAMERERLLREINTLQFRNSELREGLLNSQAIISQRDLEITDLKKEMSKLNTRLQQVLLELEKKQSDDCSMEVDVSANTPEVKPQAKESGVRLQPSHLRLPSISSLTSRRSSIYPRFTSYSPKETTSWSENGDISSRLREGIQRMKREGP
ncbi:microtubule-associated protein Dis1 [Schizosaccharomyces japonicus yFS275]|uniref:Microtubule-associated protein Dis1 n=1 Tax=Schizosaccharomyces japonicus (strain yFS275 / FY16936) TaxID=402676 RepID=B6K0R5_SCHJY|nr:microtubule-associated protein Dis1 [Schizosaccharomyces japonicus yFS275]EEB07536.1 microtubule-associated protein Dis1 [Schizosaccharomyces japonicus yFS275]